MEELSLILRKFGPLTDETLDAVFSIASRETFGPGHKLLLPGAPGRRVYFIESGILQVYMEADNGFCIDYLLVKDDLCIATDSFITGDPTRYHISAITQVRVVSTTWDELETIMEKYPDLRKCVFTIIENYRREKDWRESDLATMNAEKRVAWFQKKYPGLIGTIKDETIWTFLKLNRDAYDETIYGMSTRRKFRVTWNYKLIDLAEKVVGEYEAETTNVDGQPATLDYLIKEAANRYDNVTEDQLTSAVSGITKRKRPTQFHERIIVLLRRRGDRLVENRRTQRG